MAKAAILKRGYFSISADRADPHARDRAFDIARRNPPPGISAWAAVVAIAEVLESIGDACPEAPPHALLEILDFTLPTAVAPALALLLETAPAFSCSRFADGSMACAI